MKPEIEVMFNFLLLIFKQFFVIQYNCNLIEHSSQSTEVHIEAW